MPKSKSVYFLKSIVSVIMLAVLLSSFVIPSQVSAFNYPKIRLGKTVKGDLQDYFGVVSYKLDLNSRKKVKFDYTSSVDSNFYLYDSKLNVVFKKESIRKTNKTLTLSKGEYVVSLYNCTYDKGTYRLNVKDATLYAESIYFEKSEYNLAAGKSLKLNLKKDPKGSAFKNLKYSSSNTAVATVTNKGKVKAHSLGVASIVASDGENKKAYCTVIVNKAEIKIFSKSYKSLPKVNSTWVYYSSSDSSVVKIVNKRLRAVSQGKAFLTAEVSGRLYSVEVQVASKTQLINKAKRKLKAKNANPKSVQVIRVWRGYDALQRPTVVLNYSSPTRTGYFICNYTDNFKLNYKYSDKMPVLSKIKEV